MSIDSSNSAEHIGGKIRQQEEGKTSPRPDPGNIVKKGWGGRFPPSPRPPHSIFEKVRAAFGVK